MKKSVLILAVFLILAGGLVKCSAWMREQDAQALESCAKVHTVEQCRAWIGGDY